MARRRGMGRFGSGGILRFAERTGISRGVFGTSKGWFYVGTGLWTLRKVRGLGARKTEVLLQEELKPGQRMVIANGLATIEDVPAGADGAPVRRRRLGRRR